jgi:hypothetical protein
MNGPLMQSPCASTSLAPDVTELQENQGFLAVNLITSDYISLTDLVIVENHSLVL